MNWLARLYRLILRCYPARFQADFAEEMQIVFAEAASHARRRGVWGLVLFFLHEVITLPASLVSVYVWSLRTGEARMAQLADGPGLNGGGYQFSPWKDAIYGGMPHWLVGLVAGLSFLIASGGDGDQGSSLVSVLMAGFLVLVILSSAILVWRSGWPRWSASWYPYWGLVLLMGILYFPVLLGRKPSVLTNDWVGNLVLPVIIAYLLYRVARLDRIRGVLAALPVMMACWIPMLEFVPAFPRGASWVVCWLLAGLAAMAILRLNKLGSGLALSLGAVAIAGTVYASLGIYLGGMLPFSEPGPSPLAAFQVYVPTLLFVSGLALGPQIACTLRQLGSLNRKGALFYRLSLLGLLLMITGPLASSVSTIDMYLPWTAFFTLGSYPEPMVYLGAAIYTVSYFFLAWGARNGANKIGWGYLGLLFLATLCLPVVLAVGYPAFVVIVQIPGALIPLFFGVGLLWIAVSAWVVIKGARVLS